MIIQFREAQSQKVKNMKYLYGVIRKHGPITKGELIDQTGLKQTTCARIIDDLLQENLIAESGVGISSGGRKPIMYEINPTLYYSIGIDISRTFTKVLLLDLHLTVKEEARFQMDQESTPEKTIAFIQHTISRFMKTYNIKQTALLGIGIGAVEPLDREKGIIVDPINFPAADWKNVRIVERLEKLYPTKVLLDKGVNAAVLAEHEIGLDGAVGNLVYIIAGMGIRLGVMTDNHLFQGSADRYEKFGNGHMVVNVNGEKCVCGSYGCVHTYSTILALQDAIVKQIKGGHSSLIMENLKDPEEIDFEAICWAINQEDRLCSDVIKDFGYYTGIAVSNIITLLHPDRFILGGPMYNRLSLFYETVVQTATNRINALYPGYQVTFSQGHLGENAAAIGAGSMVIDYYLA